MRLPMTARLLIVVMIVVGAVLPVMLYQKMLSGVPELTPGEAKTQLSRPGSNAVLVDTNSPDMFRASHLVGASNWPYDRIMSLETLDDVPPQFGGKSMLLICETGLGSAIAARKLRDLGMSDVTNVWGGMQAWVADAESPAAPAYTTLLKASGDIEDLPFRDAPSHEQWVAVLSGFAIKPTYMLLSLVLVFILWRSSHRELVALRWGLTFFFIGEAACAVNYFAFGEQSYLTEFIHSFGMTLCFGFTTYAFFEGLDHWLIKYSDQKQKCAALPLCRECIKYADVPCRLRQVFYVLVPAHMILAFMPLLTRMGTPSYNTRIWGTFYNYSHPVVYQLYEFRFLPLVAIVLMVLSLAVLLFKRTDPVRWSKLLFAAGMGPLGFSLLRLFVYAPYSENHVWFTFWEEASELMFIAGAAVVLWIFRRGLFLKTATNLLRGHGARE